MKNSILVICLMVALTGMSLFVSLDQAYAVISTNVFFRGF